MFIALLILFILLGISVMPGIVLTIYGYATNNKNLKLAGIVVTVVGFQMIAAYIFVFFIEWMSAAGDYYE